MTIDAKRVAEADVSAYVLTLLDDHLSAVRDIRERMRTGTTTAPGARHTLALHSIAVAEAYADALSRVLRHRVGGVPS